MVTINRKIVRNFLLLLLFLLVVADRVGPMIGITSTFSLDDTGSVGVWYETLLYIISAGLLALTAMVLIQRKDPAGWRWGLFALFILYLSANASSRMNNKIFFTLFRLIQGLLPRVILGILFVAPVIALVVIFWPVLMKLPTHYRNMLIISGVIFGTGAILVDSVDGIFFHGNNLWLYYLEEILEYSGFILFIDAMLAYLDGEIGTITIDLKVDEPPDIEGS
jgi:hypothetical protein